jgi:hypothetical protein
MSLELMPLDRNKCANQVEAGEKYLFENKSLVNTIEILCQGMLTEGRRLSTMRLFHPLNILVVTRNLWLIL